MTVAEPMRRDPAYCKMDARTLEDKTSIALFNPVVPAKKTKKPFLLPRCGERGPANGGSSRSFAKNRLTARETIVTWKTIIMNASKKHCNRPPPLTTRAELQRLKAKIVRLHSTRLHHLLADNNAAERIEGEPTIYHVLNM
jgi:hypothetical protein